ncbi:unnamed protein product, partial [Staurois parvus]
AEHKLPPPFLSVGLTVNSSNCISGSDTPEHWCQWHYYSIPACVVVGGVVPHHWCQWKE